MMPGRGPRASGTKGGSELSGEVLGVFTRCEFSQPDEKWGGITSRRPRSFEFDLEALYNIRREF